jgi:nicotinamide mononucleotide transporter
MTNIILNFFNINNTFFTLWDYPMSYLEFFGTLLNIASVYLVAKKNIWSWPVGIVATILFGVLFYQIQLYSDFFEQIYFLITGFWGWWLWNKVRANRKNKKENMDLKFNSLKTNIILIAGMIIGTAALGYLMSNIHLYFPALFPIAATFAYLDAFTTVMSFVANMLLAYKRIENWMLWITVDIIGIWLYYAKGVRFVSLLYVIFLVIATSGLIMWLKDYKKSKSLNQTYEKRNYNREILPTT